MSRTDDWQARLDRVAAAIERNESRLEALENGTAALESLQDASLPGATKGNPDASAIPAPGAILAAPEPAEGRKMQEKADVAPAWSGQRVAISELTDFKERWGLRTVGGDPDLRGQPWRPRLYLAEV